MINNGDLKKAGEFIKDKIIVNLKAKVSAKILEIFKPMLQAQIQQGMVIEKKARLLLAGASEQLVVGTISAHSLAGSAIRKKLSNVLEPIQAALKLLTTCDR
jgi:hypothetical protein